MDKRTMRRVKISDLTRPKSGMFNVYVDSWWAVSNDDEVYFYGSDRFPFASPQCNTNPKLAIRLAERLKDNPKCGYENFKEVRQIPVVYQPTSIHEYL
jgi:hypothetical protein